MFTFDDISLKKILVPVDGSNQSKEALRRAAHLAQQFDAALTDFVSVEGFKQEPIEKILLHRQGMTKPLPALDDYVLAVATDYSLACEKPVLDINHIEQIADFIVAWYQHKCGEI